MAFRYDMQGKTPQQKAIVSQRDAEDKRRKAEQKEREKNAMKSTEKTSTRLLAINKDTCPKYDNIITKYQCQGCENYSSFELYHGQPCVYCSAY